MGAAAPTALTTSHAAPNETAVKHTTAREAQQAGALSSSAAVAPAPNPAASLEPDLAQGAAHRAAPISSAAPAADGGGVAAPCQRPAGPPAVSGAERVPVTDISAASPARPPLCGEFQGTGSLRGASPASQRRGTALARAGGAEAAPAAQSPERGAHDCEWRRRAKQHACGEEARALRAEGMVPSRDYQVKSSLQPPACRMCGYPKKACLKGSTWVHV